MDTIVVVGASAGGMGVLKKILSDLPADFAAAVCVVMHIGANKSVLPEILAKAGPLPVRHARDGDVIEPGVVLVAPPDRHLLLVDRGGAGAGVVLSHGPKENYTRPAIDPLFRSAAEACGERVVGVILSGFLDDGTVGLQAVKACGGTAVVQDPNDAYARDMPASAVANVAVDLLLPMDQIGAALTELVRRRAGQPASARAPARVPSWIALENRFFTGEAGMDELEKIATPSTFTCPECHGTLWQIKAPLPLRFRCHTGHSFTVQTLDRRQGAEAEAAIWAAVRALRERERLSEGQAELAEHRQLRAAAEEHRTHARAAADHARALAKLLDDEAPETRF